MMILQRYRFDVTYEKGSSLYVADTQPRAALPTPFETKVTGFELFRLQMKIDNR